MCDDVGADCRAVVITGMTKSGRTFRPSDWAQRLALMATAGSCSSERPVCFHPKVRIGALEEAPCVEIDCALANEDPELFGVLMNFARQHELQCVCIPAGDS